MTPPLPSFARASWKASLRLPKGAVRAWRSASAPARVHGDVVVVGGLDFSYSAHAIRERGRVAWTFASGVDDTRGALPAPLFLADEGAVVLGTADGVSWVDAATGAERARVSLGARPVRTPCATPSLLLVPLEDGRLEAVDARERRVAWSARLPARCASPVRVVLRGDGEALAVALLADGTAVGVSVADGAVRWTRETGRSVSDGVGVAHVDGAPVALFPGGDGACLWAIDAGDGAVRWRYPAGALVFGTTAVAGDDVALCTSLYGPGGNRLHGVDLRTGKRRFVVEGGYGGGLDLAVSERRAYACLGEEIVVVDVDGGAPLARGKLAHQSAATPLVDEETGAVLIATSHELLAYGASSSS